MKRKCPNPISMELDTILPTLPRRCLFCNESIQVLLTGLSAGQIAWTVTPSFPILLIVAFGRLNVETANETLTAMPGRTLILNPGLPVRLSAIEAADFLLVGGKQAAAEGKTWKPLLNWVLFNARN